MDNPLIKIACLPLLVGMVVVFTACYIIAAALAIPVWLLVVLVRGWQDVRA